MIFRYDRGLVVLVEANPSAFRVKGSFIPPRADSAAWAYPVVNDGRLYLRDQHLLMCYDIRGPAAHDRSAGKPHARPAQGQALPQDQGAGH